MTNQVSQAHGQLNKEDNTWYQDPLSWDAVANVHLFPLVTEIDKIFEDSFLYLHLYLSQNNLITSYLGLCFNATPASLFNGQCILIFLFPEPFTGFGTCFLTPWSHFKPLSGNAVYFWNTDIHKHSEHSSSSSSARGYTCYRAAGYYAPYHTVGRHTIMGTEKTSKSHLQSFLINYHHE